jgi:hypothetical protein
VTYPSKGSDSKVGEDREDRGRAERLAAIYLDVAGDALRGTRVSRQMLNAKAGMLLSATLIALALFVQTEPGLFWLRLTAFGLAFMAAIFLVCALWPTVYSGGEKLQPFYEAAEREKLPATDMMMQIASTSAEAAQENWHKTRRRMYFCTLGSMVLILALLAFSVDYGILTGSTIFRSKKAMAGDERPGNEGIEDNGEEARPVLPPPSAEKTKEGASVPRGRPEECGSDGDN